MFLKIPIKPQRTQLQASCTNFVPFLPYVKISAVCFVAMCCITSSSPVRQKRSMGGMRYGKRLSYTSPENSLDSNVGSKHRYGQVSNFYKAAQRLVEELKEEEARHARIAYIANILIQLYEDLPISTSLYQQPTVPPGFEVEKNIEQVVALLKNIRSGGLETNE